MDSCAACGWPEVEHLRAHVARLEQQVADLTRERDSERCNSEHANRWWGIAQAERDHARFLASGRRRLIAKMREVNVYRRMTMHAALTQARADERAKVEAEVVAWLKRRQDDLERQNPAANPYHKEYAAAFWAAANGVLVGSHRPATKEGT